jgi:cytochrome c biogenesis protein CcdA
MIDGQFAFAFTTGMVAAVNPCGFAMLPAYLSFFLGNDGSAAVGGDGRGERGTVAAVARALVVSVAMVLGFVVVFTVIGLALRNGLGRLNSFSGYATTALALVMIGVGIAVLAGWQLPWATPKLSKGGRSGSFVSMFVFGVSYAVASLGCALPVFISNVLNSSRRHGTVSGLIAMVMFALGMGLVIGALTVSLAVANGGLVKLLRRAMRYVDRLAGGFLVLAGIYLVVYGIEEIRLGNGTIASSGLTRTGTSFSGRLQDFLQRQDPVLLGLLLATVVAAATAAVLLARRHDASAS